MTTQQQMTNWRTEGPLLPHNGLAVQREMAAGHTLSTLHAEATDEAIGNEVD